jgi:hypothetical protein
LRATSSPTNRFSHLKRPQVVLQLAARAAPFALGSDAWDQLPNVNRLLDEINVRPAAQRAEALKEGYLFKNEMDQATMDAMYPQNKRLALVKITAQ